MPRGRPSTFTPALAEAICERLSDGESLRSICRDEGMPPASTVRQWHIDDVAGFSAQYACARNLGLDAIAEEIQEIADDSSRDTISTEDGDRQNIEWVNRSRLRVDARKWLLSKLRPDKYGDRTVLAGDSKAPLEFVVSTVKRD